MQEFKDTAILISNVKKVYKLGQIGGGTLQGDLQSWWAKVMNKEDPNSKIGSKQRISGQTFRALNGINLLINQGEAVGIIGGNGAGKSTLLKLLCRITAPTEGEIDIYGRITSMLEVGTGFNGEMTGRENIYMNGAILGMTKAEIDEKINDIIEFSEVSEFIDTPVKRYSSGMYVKLAFSVASHLNSEIMIMDEVLAVGDIEFQNKCLNKMRDAAKIEGRTILYVSHNMSTIRTLCDRCIVLDQGKIIFDGDVDTAIGIYLGTFGDLKCDYIFDKKYHSDARSIGKLELISLRLCDSSTAKFECGSLIHVSLACRSSVYLSSVKIRFEINYGDGSKVGTMFTTADYCFEKDVKTNLELALDSSHLSPGKYIVNIVAYINDQFGNEEFLDGVYPGFLFELVDTEKAFNDVTWNGKYWGRIKLHDIIDVES